MKKYKKILILLILFILYTVICAYSYANTISTNLSNNIFRLHVIANSDSKEDQDLKYKVRNSLIEYMNTISISCTTKEEVLKVVNEHINDFKTIATNTIQKNGFNYSVNIKIGNFNFATKRYGDISFLAGFYDALKVEIGDAKGQNWWCVMFPPLCFVDISSGIVPESSKELMKENMEEEDYNIISENTKDIKFKFKILEIFQNTKILTAKN